MTAGRWLPWGLSLLTAAGAVSAFVVLLWTRVVYPTRGGWRPVFEGRQIGLFDLEMTTGETIRITHPAYVYFFRTACSPCKEAARVLAAFAAGGSKGLPVYAVTIDPVHAGRTDVAPANRTIRVGRLLTGAPQLNFVQDVPLTVRTNVQSAIVKAYLGVPSRSTLEGM